MSTPDNGFQAIFELAQGVRELQQQVARLYQPVVDVILCTGSRDAAHISATGPAVMPWKVSWNSWVMSRGAANNSWWTGRLWLARQMTKACRISAVMPS